MRPLTIALICLLPIGAIFGSTIGRWCHERVTDFRDADLRALEEKNRQELEALRCRLDVEREEQNRQDELRVIEVKRLIATEQQLRQQFESERRMMRAALDDAEQELRTQPTPRSGR
jgi:hypothetical protein